MSNKTAFLPGMRIEPNVKAALSVLASQLPGDVTDQVRFASRRLIESRIQELEHQISGAEQAGVIDAQAHAQLVALRAAYESQ